MMKGYCGGGLAGKISRALITASTKTTPPTRAWTPSLEHILHQLGCRPLLTPIIVARVIDPFLLSHPSLALGFYNWAAQQPGFSHSSSTYQSLLKSLSLSRQFNNLQKLLKQAKPIPLVDPSLCRLLLTSLVAARRTAAAVSVFNQARFMISEIGPETCNSLLALLSSKGDLRCAGLVFDEMLHRNVCFSTLGFGVYVWRFCRSAEIRQTLELIDKVRSAADFSGINGSILAILVIHGLCLESRTLDAICMLEALRERECKPDFMAYRTVAEESQKKGSVDEMDRVLRKKRKLGVAPRDNDYKQFIFILLSNGLICEAKQLVEVIVCGNFPIEDEVLNIAISAISTIDPSGALSFLKFMLEKERSPALCTLINLSQNIREHDKVDELVGIFHVLSAKGYFRDVNSYNVMIEFFCKSGRLGEAYQVLQKMKKNGLSPEVSSYNALLEVCCEEDLLRPTMRLWDEMFTSGCNGNTRSYSIFIQRLVEIGQIEDACRLFCQMFDKGVKPDEAIYTSLFKGLCKCEDLCSAFEVFSKCVQQDDVDAHSALSKLILCLCKEGLFTHALRLLLDHAGDVRSLGAHVTFLKYVANAGEVSLGIKLLKQIHVGSPSMLHALHNELDISASSMPLLDPVLGFVKDLRGNIGACSTIPHRID